MSGDRRQDVTLADTLEPSSGERGFSLVELLVAMVVTLIITGAIYGLLASGQNAFRREPLLSERQQNIRSAMDIIQADLATAGAGLPAQFQIFDNGFNAGATAGTDYLQMYTSDGNCPIIPAGAQTPTPHAISGLTFHADRPLPTCYGPSAARGFFAVASGANVYIGRALLATASPAPDDLTFDPFDATKLDTCNAASCTGIQISIDQTPPVATNYIMPIKVIRYEIATDPATPSDTVPCLWRSETGGRDLASGAAVLVTANPNTAGGWRMVARGITNLKVSYLPASTALPAASPAPANPPVMVSPGGAGTVANQIVRSVVVTLTARTEIQLAAGRPVPPYQGELTTVTTPRAALANLSAVTGALQWR
jgi:prepilin-type N-terminal cleavage/methylation domain-containing protein